MDTRCDRDPNLMRCDPKKCRELGIPPAKCCCKKETSKFCPADAECKKSKVRCDSDPNLMTCDPDKCKEMGIPKARCCCSKETSKFCPADAECKKFKVRCDSDPNLMTCDPDKCKEMGIPKARCCCSKDGGGDGEAPDTDFCPADASCKEYRRPCADVKKLKACDPERCEQMGIPAERCCCKP